MSLGLDYAVVSTGATSTTVDTYNTLLLNNGAQNYVGGLYVESINPSRIGTALNGSGLQRYVKYVRYNPTTSQAIVAGPAPVYWKDETFTVVTPTLSEAFTATANSLAGWLLYNTTTVAGASAALLNGNFCFIAVGGFVANASAPASTAAGDTIVGAAGSFTSARVASGTAAAFRGATALTPITGGFSDIYIPFIN